MAASNATVDSEVNCTASDVKSLQADWTCADCDRRGCRIDLRTLLPLCLDVELLGGELSAPDMQLSRRSCIIQNIYNFNNNYFVFIFYFNIFWAGGHKMAGPGGISEGPLIQDICLPVQPTEECMLLQNHSVHEFGII